MKCQYCGTEKHEHCVTSHECLGLNLCMRCTDKLLSVLNDRNVDEFWNKEDSERHGYEPFKLPDDYTYKYLKARLKAMGKVIKLDYRYRKRLELEG